MPDWNEIKTSVETNGDVLTVTMELLREAAGAGRLGINVRADIRRALAGVGLGHVPQELPINQHEQVRLYKRGTPAGEFIEVMLTPGPQNDSTLIEKFAAQGPDYAAVVQRIREIVAE